MKTLKQFTKLALGLIYVLLLLTIIVPIIFRVTTGTSFTVIWDAIEELWDEDIVELADSIRNEIAIAEEIKINSISTNVSTTF